jgi:uncharacterized secreted protein with C-terminal beta-propeller domain
MLTLSFAQSAPQSALLHVCRKLALPAAFSASLLSQLVFAGDGLMQSASGDAWVAISKPHLYADVFLDRDHYSGAYTLTPQASDIGKAARLLLVAHVDARWFSHDGNAWQPWTGNLNELKTFASKTLSAKERLSFINDEALYAADYEVYAGYQVGTNPIVYNTQPLQFRVEKGSSDGLLRVRSEAAMEGYLKEGLQRGNSPSEVMIFDAVATGGVALNAASNAASGTAKSSERTSSTNLQELGVDEADTIKVDGSLLYMLSSCKESACLDVQALDSAKAVATPVASVKLASTVAPDGMYLVDKGIAGKKMMVSVGGQNGYGWYYLWGWHDGKTELEFLDISDPAKVSSLEKLSIDGALVASRRVGNTLYLVTRYTPMPKGFTPYPYLKAAVDANAAVVANSTLPEILPRIEDSRKQVEDLLKSKNCYLATSAVDGSANPSIISILSVPLDAPKNYTTSCFLGASETLYMSTDALYLATTSWDYDVGIASTTSASLVYSPQHTTTIHKFALANAGIEYRGSGEVNGHLGWGEDKKSFRMGEHNGYLNIATSVGDTWAGNSSTTLTVLKENTASKSLQTVKTIDGIGLKGERLYAARFVGDRGYLVTFRVTDPLYVLDLSNQEQPKVAGELKINGYSDYLHPIDGNLLLGIGKDAVPDTSSADLGGGRGAWYQGVKLSLFDVSNIATPKEINSVVLGKRGTDSDVLWDHHAMSFLPATGAEPARLAMPVRLHDKLPSWEGFKPSDPRAWYDYTHTALYSFEISKLGVTKVGSLISEVAQPVSPTGVSRMANVGILPVDTIFAPVYVYYNDRSVLKDNSVFYMHQGKVLSSKWGESK